MRASKQTKALPYRLSAAINHGRAACGESGADCAFPALDRRNSRLAPELTLHTNARGQTMGRYLLLWLIGVPVPILVLIWLFGGLH
jgi:hypothetical protein